MRRIDQPRRSSTGEAYERYLSGDLRGSSRIDPNYSLRCSLNDAANNAVGSSSINIKNSNNNNNNNNNRNANSPLINTAAVRLNSLKSTTNSAILANMAGPEARRMQRRLSASAGPGVDPLEVLNWKNAYHNGINDTRNHNNLTAVGNTAVDNAEDNGDDKQRQQLRNLFLSNGVVVGVGGHPTKTTSKIIAEAPALSTSHGGLPRDLVGCTILIPLKRRTTRSVDGLTSVGLSDKFNLHNSRGYHSDPDVDLDDLSDGSDDDSEDTSVSEITFDDRAFQNPHLLDRRAAFQHSRRASASNVVAGSGGGIGMASMGGGMGMGSSSRNLNLSSQQQEKLKYVNLRTSRGPYDESSESDDDGDGDGDEGDDTEFGESKNRSETVFPGSVIVKKPRENRSPFCGGRGPGGFVLFGGRGPGGRGLGRAMSDRNMVYGKQKSSRFLGALTGKRNSVKEEEENVDSEHEEENKNKEKKKNESGKNHKDSPAPHMADAAPAKSKRLSVPMVPPEDDHYEKPITLRPFSRSSRGSLSVASHSVADASKCSKSQASVTAADSKMNDAIAAVSATSDVDGSFKGAVNSNFEADNDNENEIPNNNDNNNAT
ncbi:hypothetical protein ACHAXS_007447 [Conticribra weissflogii]